MMHLSRLKRAVIASDAAVLSEPLKPKRVCSNEPKAVDVERTWLAEVTVFRDSP
jgi:hypothetical protein